jgi:(E)-4-hydroxy-3-methylbut-2-enyl-diphosphate synthase
MIACPTCGRAEVDLFSLAEKVDEFLKTIDEPIRVAVMGCEVNGPGEARDADIGLAAGRKMGVIFRKGKILKRVTEAEMLDELKAEILRAAEDKRNGVEVESHHNPNVYKPTLTLTSV